ncbi:MAG TPA: DUF4367 domain-containing protein [Pseudobacteroides sp.]|uniref:DUF4367 domain-containing protein n=1 Tax=Pseudobacteroides sp. TaxID=1968840 RepID=UPI002F950587
MKCQDNGFLQAYIDGELEIDIRKQLEQHLGQCEKCTETLSVLKANDDFAFMKIKAYRDNMYERVNTVNESERPIQVKSNDYNENNVKKQNKKGVSKIMLKNKKIAAVACAAVLLTSSLAFQPVRAAISNTLLIFRANDVKSINITLDDIRNIKEQMMQRDAEIDLKNMGKIKTTGGEHKNINLEEAKALTDIDAAFPNESYGINPQISTVNPYSMEFTLNVPSINKVLKTFGTKTLLPDSLDGKTFQVDFPRAIYASYNNETKDRFDFGLSKVPEIKAPEGVNPDDIYNSLLSMPIIPENIKKQLSDARDWKNTLYIPVIDSKSQEISINGAKGYVMSSDSQYTNIVWYNKGVLYSIGGSMSKDELIKIAESVR